MHDLVVFLGIYLLLGCLVFLVALIATVIWMLCRAYKISGKDVDKAIDIVDGITNAIGSFASIPSKTDNCKNLVETMILWPYRIPLGISTVMDLIGAYMENFR